MKMKEYHKIWAHQVFHQFLNEINVILYFLINNKNNLFYFFKYLFYLFILFSPKMYLDE